MSLLQRNYIVTLYQHRVFAESRVYIQVLQYLSEECCDTLMQEKFIVNVVSLLKKDLKG